MKGFKPIISVLLAVVTSALIQASLDTYTAVHPGRAVKRLHDRANDERLSGIQALSSHSVLSDLTRKHYLATGIGGTVGTGVTLPTMMVILHNHFKGPAEHFGATSPSNRRARQDRDAMSKDGDGQVPKRAIALSERHNKTGNRTPGTLNPRGWSPGVAIGTTLVAADTAAAISKGVITTVKKELFHTDKNRRDDGLQRLDRFQEPAYVLDVVQTNRRRPLDSLSPYTHQNPVPIRGNIKVPMLSSRAMSPQAALGTACMVVPLVLAAGGIVAFAIIKMASGHHHRRDMFDMPERPLEQSGASSPSLRWVRARIARDDLLYPMHIGATPF